MKISKVTPVMVVDAIEPCLALWVKQLGYTKTAEVPHGDRLGFVILEKDGSEIMLQTHASVRDDLPAVGARLSVGDVALFVEVPSLEAAKAAVKQETLIVPERTTSYGMKEIFVATRDGHVIGFAEHA